MRHPLLSLLRFLCLLALVVLMGMLYWSHLLIEEELQSTRTTLKSMAAQIAALEQQPRQVAEQTPTLSSTSRPHIDPSLPNLLQEDPFYTTALPKLLPAGFTPQGVRHSATLGRPANLHPLAGVAPFSEWIGQCSIAVAALQFGKYQTFTTAGAIKIEERPIDQEGRTEFWVHLRDDLYWQPLSLAQFPPDFKLAPQFLQPQPVTAADYKLYFDAVMNPYVQLLGAVALRNYLRDIEEFRIIDPLTFVVRWKTRDILQPDGSTRPQTKYIAKQWTGALHPFPSFLYQYFADGSKIIEDDSDPNSYRTNSTWAQNFSEHWAKNIIASCGAWTFDKSTEESISFQRNANFYNPYAVLVKGMRIVYKESVDSLWQDFKTGKLDSYLLSPMKLSEYQQFINSPEYAAQKAQGLAINRIDYVDRIFFYIGWNQSKTFFKNLNVRKAMTLAIDRDRLIAQNLNGMGVAITGPAFLYSPSYDSSIPAWPYDPQEAQRLLDAEGWSDSDGDGIRDKLIDGKRIPFRFRLYYYVKNPLSKLNVDCIATALKQIGVDCIPYGLDYTDLLAAINDKNFDALYSAWALGTPPENPRQIWHSEGATEKGSSNAIGFTNADVDRIIDQLDYTDDLAQRKALYHEFHRIIHTEIPYTFLYSPKSSLLYRDYAKNIFIPAARQDLIPGADVSEPELSAMWLTPIHSIQP